ncbi:MAG: leucine-rich repeat protein [Bacilli bacterium]|nr:leucine-rich repeat protein [Bacilli bacterium]
MLFNRKKSPSIGVSLGESTIKVMEDYLLTPDKYVFPFKIAEKNKEREIVTYNQDPNYGVRLRAIHEDLLKDFEDNFHQRNPHSFAYHKHVRTLDSLTEHMNSSYFIKLDIHHFFESITYDNFFDVYGEFFNKNWEKILSSCFYKGSLSTGYVTSPTLSDFYMSRFDREIEKYLAERKELHYSRYSDDILLSSEGDDDKSVNELFAFIGGLLGKFHLEINSKKTFKIHLDVTKKNSLTFLGLNISKEDEKKNKITISKSYILFLLQLIEKSKGLDNKNRRLVEEIKSRAAYLLQNSLISYKRFLRKHINKFGEPFAYAPKGIEVNDDRPFNKISENPDIASYLSVFHFNIHKKIVNPFNGHILVKDGIEIDRYLDGSAKEVKIPDFVDSIGPNAFAQARNLEKITIPEKVRLIGSSAFYGSGLKEITFSKGLVVISNDAFMRNSLEKVTLPSTLKYILPRAFYGSTELKTISLPKSLVALGSEAFAESDSLEKVVYPSNPKFQGGNIFNKCRRLRKVTFYGDKLSSLSEGTFSNCQSLREIYLPKGLATIGSHCFDKCSSLKSIRIPKEVLNIPTSAFGGLNISTYEVDKDNPVYYSDEKKTSIIEKGTNRLIAIVPGAEIPSSVEIIAGGLFKYEAHRFRKTLSLPEGLKIIEKDAFGGLRLIKEIVLPNSLERIEEGAFKNCLSLKKIALPNGVSEVAPHLFEGCQALEEAKLGENTKKIGEQAFCHCPSLKEINLNEGLEEIGYRAYSGCKNVESLSIPASVKKIAPYAFDTLSMSLKAIKVADNNVSYRSMEANIIVDNKDNALLLGCVNSLFPQGIESVGSYAFMHSKIKKAVLPSSLKIIEEGAFYHCDELEEVASDDVYEIKDLAFRNCESLKTFHFPDCLVNIQKEAFYKTSLEEVRLPRSLNKVSVDAFNKIASLKAIYLPMNLDGWFHKEIFDECPNIEKIEIEAGNATYFSDSHNGVYRKKDKNESALVLGCKNTTFPISLTEISANAFKGVSKLKKVIIPEGVNYIASCAFRKMPDLEEVVFKSESPSLSDSLFENDFKLKKVVLPTKLEKLLFKTFHNCHSLKEISLPETLEEIEDSCFEGCDLKEVVFGKKIERIQNRAFKDNPNLKKVDFGEVESLESIDRYAFLNCDLSALKLPICLVILNDLAFGGNRHLKSVTIGKRLSAIGTNPFYECLELESLSIDKDNETFSDMGENLIFQVEDKSLVTGTKNSHIDFEIETIERRCFTNIKIPTLRLHEGLVKISGEAFRNCGIEHLELPNSLKTIGEGAFMENDKLDEVHFGEKLSEISRLAFYGCSLKELEFPASVSLIDNSAFLMASRTLERISVNRTNHIYSDGEGSNVLCYKNGRTVILGCKNSKLPANCRNIGAYAFYCCDGLDDSFFENHDINTIEDKAFAKCLGLRKLDLTGDKNNADHHKRLETISYGAFEDCTNLTEVHFPETLKNLIDVAFSNCENLELIDIEDGALNFKSLNKKGLIRTNNNYCSILAKGEKIPEGVMAVEDAIVDIQNRKEINVPDSLAGFDDNLLIKGENLEKIIVGDNPYIETENGCVYSKSRRLLFAPKKARIPEGIKEIGPTALLHAKEIYIPNSVHVIKVFPKHKYAFDHVEVAKDNPYFMASPDGKAILFKKTGVTFLGGDIYKPAEKDVLRQFSTPRSFRF